DGLVESITDPLGRMQSFGYDAAGRVTRRTLVGGRTVGFDHDPNGRVVAGTPPGGAPWTFQWTPRGRLAAVTPPAAGAEPATVSYEYDADGALTRKSLPDGRAVEYLYDAYGRPSRIVLPDGDTIDYAYDASDRVLSINAPGSTLTYTYQGFLQTGIAWSGAVAGSVTRDVDDGLRVIRLSVAGMPFDYAYDDDDLLVGAGDYVLARDPATGLVTGATLDGLEESFAYDDQFGELGAIKATPGGTLAEAGFGARTRGR